MSRLFLLLIFVSLLLDAYIYVRHLRFMCRTVRVAYFAVMALVYMIMAAVRLFDLGDIINTMPVVFVFFLQAFPKITYFILSVWGYLVPKLNNRRGIFDSIAMICAAAVMASMLWGTLYVRHNPRVEELEFESSRLPEAFDGFKVVFFTDLHVGSLPDNNKLIMKLVETINDYDADIVGFGGDLVNHLPEEVDEGKTELLSQIRAKYGVYSVLGNHDLGMYGRGSEGGDTPAKVVDRMRDKQKEMGWILLENQTLYIGVDGDSISVSGVTFPAIGMNSAPGRQSVRCDVAATYDSVPSELFNLNICHTPEAWPVLAALEGRADLTLAGHVHAMQTKLKIGDLILTPASFLYRFVSGAYFSGRDIEQIDMDRAREWAAPLNIDESLIDEAHLTNGDEDKLLYLNDGFGYVLMPTRIGCAPELTVITLRSKSAK